MILILVFLLTRRLDIDPAAGEELDRLTKEVMNTPPDIVVRAKSRSRSKNRRW